MYERRTRYTHAHRYACVHTYVHRRRFARLRKLLNEINYRTLANNYYADGLDEGDGSYRPRNYFNATRHRLIVTIPLVMTAEMLENTSC